MIARPVEAGPKRVQCVHELGADCLRKEEDRSQLPAQRMRSGPACLVCEQLGSEASSAVATTLTVPGRALARVRGKKGADKRFRRRVLERARLTRLSIHVERRLRPRKVARRLVRDADVIPTAGWKAIPKSSVCTRTTARRSGGTRVRAGGRRRGDGGGSQRGAVGASRYRRRRVSRR